MNNLCKDDIVKNSIIEAAKRVFQKWGLHKTTMEDIAHEAGKGKSTLYYYYKSKDEIFEAMITDEFSNIIIKAKTSASKVSSSKEKLKKYIATMLVEIKNTVSVYPLVKGELKGNQYIEKLRKQLDDKEESIIMEILKEGFEKGEFNFFNETQLSKAANVIVGTIRGLELYLFLDIDDNEKIDIVTKMIAEGI
ncbi:MAG: TetR/AcrR family transcriptional regulator [Bacteroidetes bacterium]|jgi:AcrR family transcriptional regulator|nr:TetR/AcrR family transcriptional regulator [Bacteroidota bacterium]